MCDRSDWTPEEVLLVHQFDKEDLVLPAATLAIIEAFHSRIHLLEFVKDQKSEESVKAAMRAFVTKHALQHVNMHVLQEKDVEQGVLHFDQMKGVDMLLIGTHGNGGLFHKSATESLINHMYKPMLTFPI
jgi:nucleotide-binding universal stress UspA family protein